MITKNPIENLKDLYQYIPIVDIDSNGVFKYIQIRGTWYISGKDKKEDVIFIRGYGKCAYHADILDEFINEFNKSKIGNEVMILNADNNEKKIKVKTAITFDCIGGGRINHSSKDKKIFVYGYSQSFGRSNHKITTSILQDNYKDYQAENITWSNEGYQKTKRGSYFNKIAQLHISKEAQQSQCYVF